MVPHRKNKATKSMTTNQPLTSYAQVANLKPSLEVKTHTPQTP